MLSVTVKVATPLAFVTPDTVVINDEPLPAANVIVSLAIGVPAPPPVASLAVTVVIVELVVPFARPPAMRFAATEESEEPSRRSLRYRRSPSASA